MSVLPSPSDHAEMPHRMVGRQLVRRCSCGAPWPCERSAPGRWAALRVKLTEDIAIEQELGDDYSEMSTDTSEATAGWHWGKAQALRDLLAWMDREDGQS